MTFLEEFIRATSEKIDKPGNASACEVFTIRLPEGTDPDEFFRRLREAKPLPISLKVPK